jgi:hypothetical protein
MRRMFTRLALAAATLILPSLAFAQASITGTVRDTSGAVLPGVTVEASSPVLIERTRTVVTDESGQYRIVDLRPGTYALTFALSGFTTVRREDIELQGQFVSTINADLRVGALEETVTVTGESPIVDVQSIRRQTVIDGDTVKELPVARSYGALLQINPAVTTGAANLDIQITPGNLVFGGPGGRGNEGRVLLDGLNVGSALNGGGASSYLVEVGNAQEVAYSTSGGLGEAEVGGPTVTVVPRTGGNTLSGTGYLASVREWMVGSNAERGSGDVMKLWDHNLTIGGPIARDRVWYFAGIRDEGVYRKIPNMWANLNAGDPTKWTYVKDERRPAVAAGSWTALNVRLTAQATPRNRVSAFWDEQLPCESGALNDSIKPSCRASTDEYILAGAPGSSTTTASATSAPEIAGYRGRKAYGRGEYQRVQQATWTSPASSKLLLEGGVGTFGTHFGGSLVPGLDLRDFIRVTEQCSAGCPANENIPGLVYRSPNWGSSAGKQINWRSSASYVTGAHSIKLGYMGLFAIYNTNNFTNDHNLAYRVNNAVPNQLTQSLHPLQTRNRTQQDSIFIQDQSTFGRFTLTGALRFDYARSYFPQQQLGPNRFLPTAVIFEETQGVTGYKDLSPRGGFAWDVFGSGKTSVRVNVGKYLEAATNQTLYMQTNPINRIVTSVTRTWTDANGNYAADCDLLTLTANDFRAAGGDFCGQVNDLNFGRPQAASATYDPELLGGWSVRPADWQIGASVQQELLPRLSAEAGYFRRWLTNFAVTDNLATTAGDYSSFSIAVPMDERFPGGGGGTVTGLYDVNQSVASSVNNFVTFARDYGDQSQMYHGVLLNVSARPRNGLTVQGGLNTGRTTSDTCEIRAQLPETSLLNPYCNSSTGWVTRVTGLASYTVPKIDVAVAATFRTDQGSQLAANYTVSSAAIAPSLGRPLSNSAPNATINIIEPGDFRGDRINNVDLRLAKVLRIGRTRTNVGIDIYNLFDAAPVLTYTQTYSPTTTTWLRPNSVLAARFMKFSVNFDF